MAVYLIEFRLSGFAKHQIRQLILETAKEFQVRGTTKYRVVPHVTLVGPFSSSNEKLIIDIIEKVGKKYELVPFRIYGFGSFGHWFTRNRVLYARIEPSCELHSLRCDLVANLDAFCGLNKFDKGEFKPHLTIAFKDIDRKFGQIKEFLEKKSLPPINHHVLRICLLRGRRILCEYDLIQKRLLTRSQALDKMIFAKTVKELKSTLGRSQ
jgi:2'-5' RNA ligase